ncbi:uncharacterized protein [Periplaneta americana]|uniref:uncharacterized protein isoform X2 n=1 Tax=Periplaneta americana TaxID=6978 RepID=UPI0037E79959
MTKTVKEAPIYENEEQEEGEQDDSVGDFDLDEEIDSYLNQLEAIPIELLEDTCVENSDGNAAGTSDRNNRVYSAPEVDTTASITTFIAKTVIGVLQQKKLQGEKASTVQAKTEGPQKKSKKRRGKTKRKYRKRGGKKRKRVVNNETHIDISGLVKKEVIPFLGDEEPVAGIALTDELPAENVVKSRRNSSASSLSGRETVILPLTDPRLPHVLQSSALASVSPLENLQTEIIDPAIKREPSPFPLSKINNVSDNAQTECEMAKSKCTETISECIKELNVIEKCDPSSDTHVQSRLALRSIVVVGGNKAESPFPSTDADCSMHDNVSRRLETSSIVRGSMESKEVAGFTSSSSSPLTLRGVVDYGDLSPANSQSSSLAQYRVRSRSPVRHRTTVKQRRRSPSRSPGRQRRYKRSASRSLSPKHKSRSKSPLRKRSESRSPHRRRYKRSRSPYSRDRSRSRSPKRGPKQRRRRSSSMSISPPSSAEKRQLRESTRNALSSLVNQLNRTSSDQANRPSVVKPIQTHYTTTRVNSRSNCYSYPSHTVNGFEPQPQQPVPHPCYPVSMPVPTEYPQAYQVAQSYQNYYQGDYTNTASSYMVSHHMYGSYIHVSNCQQQSYYQNPSNFSYLNAALPTPPGIDAPAPPDTPPPLPPPPPPPPPEPDTDKDWADGSPLPVLNNRMRTVKSGVSPLITRLQSNLRYLLPVVTKNKPSSDVLQVINNALESPRKAPDLCTSPSSSSSSSSASPFIQSPVKDAVSTQLAENSNWEPEQPVAKKMKLEDDRADSPRLSFKPRCQSLAKQAMLQNRDFLLGMTDTDCEMVQDNRSNIPSSELSQMSIPPNNVEELCGEDPVRNRDDGHLKEIRAHSHSAFEDITLLDSENRESIALDCKSEISAVNCRDEISPILPQEQLDTAVLKNQPSQVEVVTPVDNKISCSNKSGKASAISAESTNQRSESPEPETDNIKKQPMSGQDQLIEEDSVPKVVLGSDTVITITEEKTGTLYDEKCTRKDDVAVELCQESPHLPEAVIESDKSINITDGISCEEESTKKENNADEIHEEIQSVPEAAINKVITVADGKAGILREEGSIRRDNVAADINKESPGISTVINIAFAKRGTVCEEESTRKENATAKMYEVSPSVSETTTGNGTTINVAVVKMGTFCEESTRKESAVPKMHKKLLSVPEAVTGSDTVINLIDVKIGNFCEEQSARNEDTTSKLHQEIPGVPEAVTENDTVPSVKDRKTRSPKREEAAAQLHELEDRKVTDGVESVDHRSVLSDGVKQTFEPVGHRPKLSDGVEQTFEPVDHRSKLSDGVEQTFEPVDHRSKLSDGVEQTFEPVDHRPKLSDGVEQTFEPVDHRPKLSDGVEQTFEPVDHRSKLSDGVEQTFEPVDHRPKLSDGVEQTFEPVDHRPKLSDGVEQTFEPVDHRSSLSDGVEQTSEPVDHRSKLSDGMEQTFEPVDHRPKLSDGVEQTFEPVDHRSSLSDGVEQTSEPVDHRSKLSDGVEWTFEPVDYTPKLSPSHELQCVTKETPVDNNTFNDIDAIQTCLKFEVPNIENHNDLSIKSAEKALESDKTARMLSSGSISPSNKENLPLKSGSSSTDSKPLVQNEKHNQTEALGLNVESNNSEIVIGSLKVPLLADDASHDINDMSDLESKTSLVSSGKKIKGDKSVKCINDNKNTKTAKPLCVAYSIRLSKRAAFSNVEDSKSTITTEKMSLRIKNEDKKKCVKMSEKTFGSDTVFLMNADHSDADKRNGLKTETLQTPTDKSSKSEITSAVNNRTGDEDKIKTHLKAAKSGKSEITPAVNRRTEDEDKIKTHLKATRKLKKRATFRRSHNSLADEIIRRLCTQMSAVMKDEGSSLSVGGVLLWWTKLFFWRIFTEFSHFHIKPA